MANRFAGEAAVLHPSLQISAVLPYVPTALSHAMALWPRVDFPILWYVEGALQGK